MTDGRRIVLSEDDFRDPEPAAPAETLTAPPAPSSPDVPLDRPHVLGKEPGRASAGSPLRSEPHPRPAVSAPAFSRDESSAIVSDRPRVGGWGVAIFFFGLIGGAIGYFALKGTDPRRADHVLKWGLIITAVSIAAWVLLWIIVLAIVAHGASSSALGVGGGIR